MTSRPLAIGRIGWGVVDQAASTLTNFVGLALIARQVAPAEFGAVSVTFVAIAVALAFGRGTWGEALLILAGRRPELRRELATTALAGSALHGAAVGVLLVVLGWVSSSSLGPLLLVAGVGMPALLLQDAGRYVFYGRSRPDLAALSDISWLVSSITLVTVTARLTTRPEALVVAWLCGLVPALVVTLCAHEWIATRPAVRTWLSAERRVYLPLTGDIMGGPGARALALAALIAVVGLVEGGGFRAAQIIMGPITVLTLAAPPLFLARYAGSTSPVLRSGLRVTALSLGAVAAIWVIIAALIPSSIGAALLGEVWMEARPVLMIVGALQVAAAVSLVPFLGLRSQGRTDLAFKLRLISGVALVTAAACGALVGGVRIAVLMMGMVEVATFVLGLRWLRMEDEDGGATRVLHTRIPMARRLRFDQGEPQSRGRS
jgi:O-antigen/teichoic acid export membrane protein